MPIPDQTDPLSLRPMVLGTFPLDGEDIQGAILEGSAEALRNAASCLYYYVRLVRVEDIAALANCLENARASDGIDRYNYLCAAITMVRTVGGK